MESRRYSSFQCSGLTARRRSVAYAQKRESICGHKTKEPILKPECGNEKVESILTILSALASKVQSSIFSPSQQPSTPEINVQTRMILRDYIYRKLESKQCLTFKVRLKFSGDELSNFVVSAGEILEKHYPHVYAEVCRKMGMTMSTPEVTKAAILTILDALFRSGVNWGKLLSVLAITSSFALECVQQGHSNYVDGLIECVVHYISYNLNEWLHLQGGWGGFKLEYEKKRRVSTELIHLAGIIVILLCIIFVTFLVVIIKS